jgi:hypothetical protein
LEVHRFGPLKILGNRIARLALSDAGEAGRCR